MGQLSLLAWLTVMIVVIFIAPCLATLYKVSKSVHKTLKIIYNGSFRGNVADRQFVPVPVQSLVVVCPDVTVIVNWYKKVMVSWYEKSVVCFPSSFPSRGSTLKENGTSFQRATPTQFLSESHTKWYNEYVVCVWNVSNNIVSSRLFLPVIQ